MLCLLLVRIDKKMNDITIYPTDTDIRLMTDVRLLVEEKMKERKATIMTEEKVKSKKMNPTDILVLNIGNLSPGYVYTFAADTFRNTVLEKYIVSIKANVVMFGKSDYTLLIEHINITKYQNSTHHYSIIECINKIKDYLDTNKYAVTCHGELYIINAKYTNKLLIESNAFKK